MKIEQKQHEYVELIWMHHVEPKIKEAIDSGLFYVIFSLDSNIFPFKLNMTFFGFAKNLGYRAKIKSDRSSTSNLVKISWGENEDEYEDEYEDETQYS